MGYSTFAHCAAIALLIASTFAGGCAASRDCPFGSNNTNHRPKHGNGWWQRPNKTHEAASNKIIVGGSEPWRFGFNYTDWALKHGPFYINDVLVFKYDPPSNGSHPHSVYLLATGPLELQELRFESGREVGRRNTHGGGDNGFEFRLKSRKPYYFACGESNGIHCNLGLTKFIATPSPRGWRNIHQEVIKLYSKCARL